MKRETAFYSKKNQVALIDCAIKKTFANQESFEREVQFYQLLQVNQSLKIPKMIAVNMDLGILKLEYLPGFLVQDLVEKYEDQSDTLSCSHLMIELMKWILTFHRDPNICAQGLALQDVNLRNFIWYDQQIYGIDFEDIAAGSLADDLSKLIAMYLSSRPENTAFKHAVVQMLYQWLSNYDRDLYKNVQVLIPQETERITKRRESKKQHK